MQILLHNHLTPVMTGSPSTYIKEENDDFAFNPHQYLAAGKGFNMNQQQYGAFASSGGDMSGVNPSELTTGSMHQYGSHMSGSFMGGGGGTIQDDELLDLGNLDEPQQYMNGFSNNAQPGPGYFAANNGQMYSHTPDTNPIGSPFMNHQFDYAQYRQGMVGMQNGSRRGVPNMDRHHSDSRSPMTPTTPGMRMHGSLGTPDSNSLHHTLLNTQLNHQAKQNSDMWNHGGHSGSAGSGWDSPLASPQNPQFSHAISEIMHSGKHASLPAKVENGMHPNLHTAEAKKKRRRESHNAVERRRRDNINERIHDLSRLVPAHRLDDEKIRKHLSNNGPLSPTLGATGMSPPAATSLLAGGTGRRAAGNITQGLPLEDKDKGPNKGDILNGAVSWTRDLMWRLYLSYKNEEQLQQYIESQGLTWPLSETEDEKRMKSELKFAVEKNGWDNFSYSRGPGSGLRVPGYTGVDGQPLNGNNASVSPGGTANQNYNNWMNHSDSSHRGSFSLKEEDEGFGGMEMG